MGYICVEFWGCVDSGERVVEGIGVFWCDIVGLWYYW